MTPLASAVSRYMVSPPGRLRRDEELHLILKRRLTKKEYKLFLAAMQGSDTLEGTRVRLGLSPDRCEKLLSTLRKKLNRDRIKRELALSE